MESKFLLTETNLCVDEVVFSMVKPWQTVTIHVANIPRAKAFRAHKETKFSPKAQFTLQEMTGLSNHETKDLWHGLV